MDMWLNVWTTKCQVGDANESKPYYIQFGCLGHISREAVSKKHVSTTILPIFLGDVSMFKFYIHGPVCCYQ